MSRLLRMRHFSDLYDIVLKNHSTDTGLSDTELMNYIESIRRALTALHVNLIETLEQA